MRKRLLRSALCAAAAFATAMLVPPSARANEPGLASTATPSASVPPGPAGDATEPSPAALLFGKRCGGCHSIGEGDKAGPDLLDVTKRRDRKWLTSFILTPGTLIDGGDPVANELLAKFKGSRMPDQSLTPDELSGVIAYLEECSTKGGCRLATAKVKPARDATPADIAAGKALFEGVQPLAKGGAACVSCHTARGSGLAGGGTLAKDLTHAFARLGEQGTSSALASTPFPLMKDIYAKAPLSDQEAFKIKAFLYSTSVDPRPVSPDHDFLYLGALATLAFLGVLSAVSQKRLGGVRKNLVRKASR